MDTLFGLSPLHWIGSGLVTTRLLALLYTAPFFGVAVIPGRLRGSLALLIALILMPTLSMGDGVAGVADLPHLGLAVLGEIVIGIVLGLTLSLFFAGVTMAGEVAGVQVGVGAASVMDPASDISIPVVSNLFYMSALAVWFAVDGHLILISALAETLYVMPPGTFRPNGGALLQVALGLSVTIEAAVRIAAPVLISLLLANVAIAILARISPQMNVFASAFPVTLGLGFVVLLFVMAPLVSLVAGWTEDSYALLGRVFGLLTTPSP